MHDELLTGCDMGGTTGTMLRRAQLRRAPSALLGVALPEYQPGDAACAALGQQLRANVRAHDLVCWLGPAGYVVVLVNALPDEAASAAARLTRALGVPVAVIAPDFTALTEVAQPHAGGAPAPASPPEPLPFPTEHAATPA